MKAEGAPINLILNIDADIPSIFRFINYPDLQEPDRQMSHWIFNPRFQLFNYPNVGGAGNLKIGRSG